MSRFLSKTNGEIARRTHCAAGRTESLGALGQSGSAHRVRSPCRVKFWDRLLAFRSNAGDRVGRQTLPDTLGKMLACSKPISDREANRRRCYGENSMRRVLSKTNEEMALRTHCAEGQPLSLGFTGSGGGAHRVRTPMSGKVLGSATGLQGAMPGMTRTGRPSQTPWGRCWLTRDQ